MFNWSEVHFFGSVSYEIHILVIEAIKTQATSYKVLTRDLNPIWHKPMGSYNFGTYSWELDKPL